MPFLKRFCSNTSVKLLETLQQAVRLHQSGEFDAAEKLYRQVLAQSPEQADACHLLGVLLGARGEFSTAIELIRKAIVAQPDEPAFHNNLGNLLRSTHQTAAAIETFQTALRLRGDYFEALNNLGNALTDAARHDEAIDTYRAALALRPQDARLHSNLAAALFSAGQTDAALAAHRAAVTLDANEPFAWDAFGATLLRANQPTAAVAAFERAVSLAPAVARLHVHLAAALREADQYDRAADACKSALRLDPHAAEAHNTLANVLAEQGDFTASLAATQQALALRPDYADAHANLGVCYVEQRNLPAALQSFERALALDPESAETHRNYGMALLSGEQFDSGFREYEWRWKSRYFRGHACNATPPDVKRWTGGSLEGQDILLVAEQGLGDTIQFARFIPSVIARARRVSLQCPPSLIRLMQSIEGIHRIVRTTEPTATSTAAFWCPLMSLPAVLAGENSISIPAHDRYLHASAETSTRWRGRIAPFAHKLKIGLVWSGNPSLQTDHRRSVPLTQWAPLLAAAPQAQFFSVQVGPAAAQAAAFLQMINWSGDLSDFAETAGLVEQLDLIIAVDTAVAHLAGALGKPTWVLIPRISDWRWGVSRTDSLWYPRTRLFRQNGDDWNSVIKAIANELAAFDRSRNSRSGPLSPVHGGEG